MSTEKSKTNEPFKFVLNFSQKLDFRISNKQVALQKLFFYYTWENIRKKYKDNKLKTNRMVITRWFLFCFRYSRLYRIYY